MNSPFYVPWREAIVADVKKGLIPRIWQTFFESLSTAQTLSAQVLSQKNLTTQTGAIATIALPITDLKVGRYRLTYRVRITRAASVSSSLTVTLSWTDGGVACSQSFAAVTGNATSTVQSGTIMVQADEGTSISYATAYASSGATTMQYALDVVAERMP